MWRTYLSNARALEPVPNLGRTHKKEWSPAGAYQAVIVSEIVVALLVWGIDPAMELLFLFLTGVLVWVAQVTVSSSALRVFGAAGTLQVTVRVTVVVRVVDAVSRKRVMGSVPELVWFSSPFVVEVPGYPSSSRHSGVVPLTWPWLLAR